MEFIILLFTIFTISVLISNISKRKLELIIPISVIAITIIIYIAGLFDNLNVGVNIVEIIAILATIYNIVTLIRDFKNNTIKEEIKRIITPGLFAYIAIFMIFIIINEGRIFEDYDEFNHWAKIIKNMYMYNGYGTVENSIVTFNEYPPFTACFQYLLVNIKGQYSEDLVIIAQNILYLSIIIPICEKVDFGKKFKNLLLVFPVILILPLVFYEDFFVNILVDGFLGILFGMGLFLIYNENYDKLYKNITLSLIMVALVLTKTTGILFAVLLIIFEIIKSIIDKKDIKEELKKILIISALPTILLASWYAKITIAQAEKEWDFSNVLEKKEDNQINQEYTKKYINALFTKDVITSKQFTAFGSVILLFAYSISIYQTRKNKQEKKNYKYTLIAIIISTLIFLIGLLWMYLTIFEREETRIFASYSRYISTILLTWTLVNTLIICNQKEIKATTIYIFISIIIVTMPLKTIYSKYIQNIQYKNSSYIKRNYYTKIKQYEDLFTKDDKIFFLSNTEMDKEYLLKMCKYEMMGVNIANTDTNGIGSKEQFAKTLMQENYTYVYVYKITENLNEEYKELFNNQYTEPQTLYKVEINEKNELKLQKISKKES